MARCVTVAHKARGLWTPSRQRRSPLNSERSWATAQRVRAGREKNTGSSLTKFEERFQMKSLPVPEPQSNLWTRVATHHTHRRARSTDAPVRLSREAEKNMCRQRQIWSNPEKGGGVSKVPTCCRGLPSCRALWVDKRQILLSCTFKTCSVKRQLTATSTAVSHMLL